MTAVHHANGRARTTTPVEWVTLGLSAIITLCMLGWVLRYCNHGFDFTDEGFYLISISNPFHYGVQLSQFGFVYYPLFQLVDGDIPALRQASILITFSLAWILSHALLRVSTGDQSLPGAARLITSGAIASAALLSVTLTGRWLPGPSYNSLALQALLVAALGLVLAEQKPTPASVLGWTLIAVGGWLAFMAKPTTCAALGLVSGITLLAAGRFSIRLAATGLGLFVFFLALTALAIDGSILGYVDRFEREVEILGMRQTGHTLSKAFRVDDIPTGLVSKTGILLSALAISFASHLSRSRTRALSHVASVAWLLLGLSCLMTVLELPEEPSSVWSFRGPWILSAIGAAILMGFMVYRLEGLRRISRLQWALALGFVVFPYAYVIGANSNYWFIVSGAGIFWVLSGLVFLGPIPGERRVLPSLLHLGIAVQLLTAITVRTSVENPFRQPRPLRSHDFHLGMRNPISTLTLPRGFGQYLAEIFDAADAAGFEKGMPMIDLTGQSPGVLFALEARSVGSAWLLGGYVGSEAWAVELLSEVPCAVLASSWLLYERHGPRTWAGRRAISPEVLASFGAALATDYRVVGRFETAEGTGGFQRARVQRLLKPDRSIDAATDACESVRSS